MEIDQKEKKIIKQYINNGFVINKIKNLVYIEKIKKKFINLIKRSPNFKKVRNQRYQFWWLLWSWKLDYRTKCRSHGII